ncbi:MAG: hypothetical protein M3Y45_04480 [Actinomycetota bacterium]|nr:hypothetical protein [Actinomycetota bacterium]
MPEIADANALRGDEFRKLIRKPKTWIFIGIPALVATAFGAAMMPLLGVAFLAVAVLIGLAICFWIADHRSAKAFFGAYATARGLNWHEGGQALDGSSPFLRKGDKRKVNQLFTGSLADGIDGSLALYTYTVESTDSNGNDSDTDYPFTVVTVRMPETVAHLPELRVQNKSGFKALEKFEDSFRRKHERVTLESEALRDRFEIFVRKDQDQIWVRRLFSPSFIVWLTESPPKKFAFEIEEGYFVAYLPKHRESVEGLDEMIAVSCHVAGRLQEEVTQTSPATAREA